ncbi:MAG: alpha-amylase family glycosyl hydrolase [Myxococcales bacterium]|jgi:glycosidase
MVLRKVVPLLLAGALVTGAGCVKRAPVVRLPQKTPVAVAFVLDYEQQGELAEVPDSLKRRVNEALRARNLEPFELPFDSYSKLFVPVRDTQRRLARLKNGEAPLTLLVETKSVFFSQLNGRYRWMVYTRLSIAKKDGSTEPMTVSMDQSAFVDFEHQREAAAVEAVSGEIANRVGALLDDFLGSTLEGEAPAARAPLPGQKSPIYFVMVDRFFNGDPSNDGAIDRADPAAFHGGDIQGVIDRLDDLKAMGVGTVWLSPVFAMRTEKFFEHGAFHGYWVEDITKVEPRFGDAALLRKLSDELHARGMKLVLDVVLNHVAMDSPLVAQRPEWFHRQGPLENWDDEHELVNHDVHGLPDLAQENPEVFSHLLRASLRWVEEVRPDGFRLDAVKHVSLDFWARFNAAIRDRAGRDFLLLGEMLDGDPALIARTQREGRFGAMFDFPLYFALIDVYCRDESAARLGAALSSDRLYDDPDSLVTMLDNHDLPRVVSSCKGDLERVKGALTFQLTARGTPSLTYGIESALAGAKEPENRADMRFDEQPLREHIAALLRLRREHPALDAGAPRILRADKDVFAYARLMPDEAAIIVVNRTNSPVRFELPSELSGQGRDALSGKELEPGVVEAAPRATMVALIAAPRADGFAEVAADAFRQWRRGDRRREVRFAVSGARLGEGEALYLVGSGQEMGVWRPQHGLGPFGADGLLRASLPVESAYEFKLVVRGADGTARWESGDNRQLFVGAGEGVQELKLAWRQ